MLGLAVVEYFALHVQPMPPNPFVRRTWQDQIAHVISTVLQDPYLHSRPTVESFLEWLHGPNGPEHNFPPQDRFCVIQLL